MRKLAIVLLCCFASSAWGQTSDPNLLLYEGFNYDAGQPLAPPGVTSTPPDPTVAQGLQHVESGNFWYSAGISSRPTVAEGNVYIPGIGIPEPRTESPSNSLGITSAGATGTSPRLEVPNMPTGAKTVYWSGFLNVTDVDDLGSAPGLGLNETGAIFAGFNNNRYSQAGNPTAIGGLLGLKRATANPFDANGVDPNPRFRSYYVGVGTNAASGDCTNPNGYVCADRRYADYTAEFDDPLHPLYPTDLPSTYKTAGSETRSQFTAVPLAEGTPYFVVVSLDVVDGVKNDVAKLWISPDPSSFGLAAPPDPSVTVTTSAASGNDLDSSPTVGDTRQTVSFLFRNNGGTAVHSPELALFDELRIGLNWASVTGGAIAPPAVQADYNGDGTVDAADYVLWRAGGPLMNEVHEPGNVTQEDYDEWRARFGNTNSSPASGTALAAVPEPASLVAAMVAAVLILAGHRRMERRGAG